VSGVNSDEANFLTKLRQHSFKAEFKPYNALYYRHINAYSMKKLLFDFFPIAIFFVVYKWGHEMLLAAEEWLPAGISQLTDLDAIILATAALIPASIFQVAYAYWRTRKVEKMYLVTLFLVIVLGGATVILNNKVFIQWKPTIVNWLFAVAFLGSQYIGNKNFLERMMGEQISLESAIWKKLNFMWIGFFLFSGAVNIYVAFSGQFTEDQWVNFKLFGMLGLTLVFVVLQGIYLSRHINEADLPAGPPSNNPNT